jgi:hypothetical protein
LEYSQQLLTRSILTIIIESLSQNFLLLYWIQLVDPVGKDPVLGRGKLGGGFTVTPHIAKIVYDKTHLVFMRYHGAESLKLQLLE